MSAPDEQRSVARRMQAYATRCRPNGTRERGWAGRHKALDHPGALGPRAGPALEPREGRLVGRDSQLAEYVAGFIQCHGGVRGLVRIDPDRDHVRASSSRAARTVGHRGGQPELQEAVHASIEPRRRRSVTDQHAMSEPHRQVGKKAGSQSVIDLAPYGLASPRVLGSSKQVRGLGFTPTPACPPPATIVGRPAKGGQRGGGDWDRHPQGESCRGSGRSLRQLSQDMARSREPTSGWLPRRIPGPVIVGMSAASVLCVWSVPSTSAPHSHR